MNTNTEYDHVLVKLKVDSLIAERNNYLKDREDTNTLRNKVGRTLVRFGSALMTKPGQIEEDIRAFAVAHAR